MLIILPEWLSMEAPRENPRRSLRQSSRSWRIPSQPCNWKGFSSECSNCCHHCGALLALTSWPSGWTGRCMGSSWPTWPCRSPPWRRAGDAWWWWEGWSSRQERLLLVGERVGKWASIPRCKPPCISCLFPPPGGDARHPAQANQWQAGKSEPVKG